MESMLKHFFVWSDVCHVMLWFIMFYDMLFYICYVVLLCDVVLCHVIFVTYKSLFSSCIENRWNIHRILFSPLFLPCYTTFYPVKMDHTPCEEVWIMPLWWRLKMNTCYWSVQYWTARWSQKDSFWWNCKII